MSNLEDVLIGRKIVGANLYPPAEEIRSYVDSHTTGGEITLDDGTKVEFRGVSDCCSAWDITYLATTDNIITAVEYEDDEGEGESYDDEPTYFKIFVLSGDKRINIMECEGNAGNYPYYATGYYFDIIPPKDPNA